MKTIRIGSGAGYAGDRLEPALDLLKYANLDYICFEGLAERTIALAQKNKKADPKKGYNELLLYRMEKVLPLLHQNKTKVITNMGAANPKAAMEDIAKLAKHLGLENLKIAAVLGDDISHKIEEYTAENVIETSEPLYEIKKELLSANAYLGIEGIVEALKNDADIIITGRVADPSLFLAPMVYKFGWEKSDWEKKGKGTLIGHLLECAGQVTGGYFADPGIKDVPNLWNLGFPYVEVDASGEGFITKFKESGGMVTTATCTEQLLYEIHDPENYLTPDCIADFSKVIFKETAQDKVKFEGASGKEASHTYKVSVGYLNGFIGEGQMSYGGPNCIARALLAKEIVEKRLEKLPFDISELRCELIGINSLLNQDKMPDQLNEVRLRVAGKTQTKEEAQQIANEVETLYTNGPYGGGGATKKVDEIISIASILIPKEDFKIDVHYIKI
ncbi:MAG: ABC transporter substrate-binding protein [Pseudozobellia sp.]|nr:ABC transporter substrate-binding protein [Pseudozobellia sp.]MBG49058.1 ABC transporter substrate-binding protein [Pseudozobellia sp.]|tara:strand:+ start:202 stop:1539 length:1338 start_codon:yes stop_codon:yes gene_type:complete